MNKIYLNWNYYNFTVSISDICMQSQKHLGSIHTLHTTMQQEAVVIFTMLIYSTTYCHHIWNSSTIYDTIGLGPYVINCFYVRKRSRSAIPSGLHSCNINLSDSLSVNVLCKDRAFTFKTTFPLSVKFAAYHNTQYILKFNN